MISTADLSAAFARSRADAVSLLKDERRQMLDRFARSLEHNDGLTAMFAYADETDALMRAVCDFVFGELFPTDSPPAFAAVGGYGRCELAPYSDTDILFIVGNDTARDGISFMITLLWDIGLKVGQAVRTPEQCEESAKTEMSVRTNLLESRFIWGNYGLFNDFSVRYDALRRATDGREFVDAKIAERNDRYERMGQSKYMLEPNVKEGRGGLRDLHLMFWLFKYLFDITDMPDLVERGVLSQSTCDKFLKAHRFLTTVRCHLHLINGKAGDVLTFDAQKRIAERMGYVSRNGQSAVERFMKHYYLVCRDVGDLSWLMTVVIGDALTPHPAKSDIDGEPDFVLINDRISFKSETKDPLLIFKAFALKQKLGKPLHPQTVRFITENAKTVRSLRGNAEANALFFSVLTGERAETTLRQMVETGVLGVFMPVFRPIVAQVQFDMYHVYTTDEHTLKAVGFMTEHGKVPMLAALLHDIGKGRGGRHEEIGAAIALKIAAGLGLEKAEAEDVAWLVRHHLLMSQYAFRRDIFDPKTLTDFVNTVQSPERLRDLFALTRADIKAVGPAVWNAFKEQLLSDLYTLSLEKMRGIEGHARELSPSQKAVAEGGKTDGYVFAVRADEDRGVTELIVSTPTHDGLFSELTGALAVCDVSVVEAQIMTLPNGMALDTFLVQDERNRPLASAKRIERLKSTIERSRETDFEPMLAQKRQKAPKAELDLPARVFIDNDASEKCTLIEINGTDRVGFLHTAVYAMSRLNLGIVSAHIYTYGSRIVDVFYVAERRGAKITDPARIEEIKNRLTEELNGTSFSR